MQFLSNGIGASGGGHVLLNRAPLQVFGNIWFVDSVLGADAGSPRGKNPEYPLATLGQAVTNASNGDIVVLRSTHDEIISATVTIDKRLVVVGEGRSSGIPSAVLRNDCSADSMLAVDASSAKVINVRFVTATGSSDVRPHLDVGEVSSGAFILYCQFEAATEDTTYRRVALDGNYIVIEDCAFKSAGTDVTAPPNSLLFNNSLVRGLTIRRCTFDGGQTGFNGNGYAVDCATNNTYLLYMEDVSLLNGADIGISGSTDAIVHVIADSTSRVKWL